MDNDRKDSGHSFYECDVSDDVSTSILWQRINLHISLLRECEASEAQDYKHVTPSE